MSFLRSLLLFALLLTSSRAEEITLRVGYFPNITHAQGVIGAELTREHRGWFEQRLGPGIKVEWYAFNAGPSAMEAIFAGSIDLTYVGPNPALNAYIRSQGDEIRVLAGAVEGGAALVIPADGHIATAADFKGKRIATPQLGNTQDVAARVWLKQHGFRTTLTGGDVLVLPTANADQLQLFQEGQVDGVWTVEPWVSRLEREAGGKILVEQKDAVTTVLVASVNLLKTHPEIAERFRRAHSELTLWIRKNPKEAKPLVRTGISADVHHDISAALIDNAWRRLRFTDRVTTDQFAALVADAQTVGFLKNAIPLDRLFSHSP